MGGNSGQKKKPRRLATRAAKPNTERVNQGQYVEIASEDDEMISQAILKWSGLKPEWDRYELSRLFNFGGAIAFECENIEWETKEWSTAPGMGGNWYTVWTSNDTSLKAEMKVRLARLLKENKSLIRENLQEAKLIAAERARQIAGGPVTRLHVADDGVRTFDVETYEPDIRSVLGVPAEHWTEIRNGDPIEYKEVRSVYNGLYSTTSWLFNCDVRGSVSVCRPDEEPAFTGSLDDFIQSEP